ncbi:molybdate ABC transporter substrate-binding protein [Nocardia sp. CDC159]|uniref:Molybdate ABC transporter substrate-binding protein n=1 Tax=Nocardia pulmonis TaxID=2951408 RepID=A0A9X2IYE7_9NOCA|nr:MULTISPECIES: molybdate ABC transporter substrate-binding protein [Nocardia]MCM6776992.1 molybdate ABC transporter substrate-binding protein [Nocardia pulmonis]MCM6789416.1 molybdate ABC transporter substrate-binding protein [Nocardia sp. CDC159]
MRRVAVVLIAAAVVAALGSCGAQNPGGDRTTLTVFAAASLNKVFTDLGAKFETSHPNTRVTFNFAGSSELAAQLNQGAPADVFAAADTANMGKVTKSGRITEPPENFATNVLTIVTPPGNPKHIAALADLSRPGLRLVVCAPQVPCGSATQKVAAAAHVSLAPVSEESAVTDVLGKVISGEADAGLVYVTDAAGAGAKVVTVPFPESSGAVNTYPIAAVADSKQAELAHQFEALVTGPDGRAALARAGFGAP